MKDQDKIKNEVRMQVRVKSKQHSMHIQGVDPSIQMNREYGMAFELSAARSIIKWLGNQTPTHYSPASGDLLYIEYSIAKYNDDVYQMLIEGEEFNHPSGVMLDMNMESPICKNIVEFAKKSGLLEAGIGEPYDSKKEGYGEEE